MGKISAFYTLPHPPIAVPEIGKGEDEKIKGTIDAFNKVAEEIALKAPDTIIIVTPHGLLFNDAIAMSYEKKIKGDLGEFSAPQVSFNSKLDLDLTKKIAQYAGKEDIITVLMTKNTAKTYDMELELDHGTMVPLYFINEKYTDYKLVHITYGLLPKMQLYKFGMCIKKAAEDSDVNAVFIASGDLSHMLTDDGPYGYSPFGAKFDDEIISLLKTGDVSGIFSMDKTAIEKAGECGLRSYYVMLGAMNGYKFKGNLLSYEGIFGVGYSIMSFFTKETNINTYEILIDQNKKRFRRKIDLANPYLRLARESLTYFLATGKYMDTPSYVTEDMLTEKRGVFVSLKMEDQLRGCIGTVFPTTKNVAEEIIRNAVEAGRDPRFIPVTQDELEELDFSVDILTEPEETTREDLEPEKFGVIVRSEDKSGLLLPNLEGVDTVEEQLSIALQKGEIHGDEEYIIERFEVIRHKEV